jgi:hypothetical protein
VADDVVSGQIDPAGVIADGENPHHGQAGQPGYQAARKEPADPVGPLKVINRDEQRSYGSAFLQEGRNAVGQQQRFADQAGDLLVLFCGRDRVPARAQRRDHGGTRPDLFDRVTLAPADPDRHAGSLLTDLRQERGLADTGRTGEQHAGAGPVLAGTTQCRQRTGHRLAATPQRSCPQGTPLMERHLSCQR